MATHRQARFFHLINTSVMTEEQREELKKKVAELLCFQEMKVGNVNIMRLPGGFMYQYGTTASFMPYNEIVALDLNTSNN